MAKQAIMMIVDTGTIPTVLLPKRSKESGIPEIGIPPEIKYDAPWKIVCVENVAIIGGIPILATMKPLRKPIAVAAIKLSTIATQMFSPQLTINVAQMILTKVMIDTFPMMSFRINNLISLKTHED